MDIKVLYAVLGLLLCINFSYMLWARKNRLLKKHLLANLLVTLLFMGLLPGLWSWAVSVELTNEFQKTSFCTTECHTMDYYGKSLTVPDDEPLASVHFRNNYVDQKKACYTCHTSYSAFGGVKSKYRGFLHVWANYFGDIPDTLHLYTKYKNQDCLHCHGPSERFQTNKKHLKKKDFLIRSKNESLSCLECHDVAHWVPSAEEDDDDEFDDEDEFEDEEEEEGEGEEGEEASSPAPASSDSSVKVEEKIEEDEE